MPKRNSFREEWIRPLFFYGNNWLSLFGGAITTAAAMVLIGFWVIGFFGHGASSNPYLGIIAGGSSTFAIGNIVVDQLRLNAAGTIHMDLNGASLPGPPEASILFGPVRTEQDRAQSPQSLD